MEGFEFHGEALGFLGGELRFLWEAWGSFGKLGVPLGSLGFLVVAWESLGRLGISWGFLGFHGVPRDS